MKNRTKTVAAYADFPMRKLIVAMMGLAVAAIFLSSFLRGPNVPQQRESAKTKTMSSEVMSAVPELMARVKDNPKDEEAILELGEIFNRAGDWQKSLHFWTKAVELNPDNLGAHFHRAYALVELQRYEEAIPDYEFIIRAKPGSYQAHYYLGMIYKHVLSKPEVAKRHFQLALDAKPKESELASDIQKELSDMK